MATKKEVLLLKVRSNIKNLEVGLPPLQYLTFFALTFSRTFNKGSDSNYMAFVFQELSLKNIKTKGQTLA